MAVRPRCGVRPCASHAGMRKECGAGSLNWSIFLTSALSIFLLSETFLNLEQAIRLDSYVCHRTDRPTTAGGTAHVGPPWYSPPPSARSGPVPLGDHYHPSHNGWQTCVNPCGLPFAFPPTHRSGPDSLFRRGTTCLDGWRPERQIRRLELAAEHETGKTPK